MLLPTKAFSRFALNFWCMTNAIPIAPIINSAAPGEANLAGEEAVLSESIKGIVNKA